MPSQDHTTNSNQTQERIRSNDTSHSGDDTTPRAPIAEDNSTSDAPAPSRPHSNRPAPADAPPSSVRPPSNSRNRPPRPAASGGGATDSPAQDVKSPGRTGQKRRVGRFNPNLSEPKADAPAPSSGTNPSRKRGKPPSGNDLTSILTISLSTPPYPECMICFNPVRPEQPTWSCSPREEKDAQSCWNTFHLKCIQPWAEKSVKDIEEAWRARGDEKKGEWRCPGCQSKREVVPRKYWCFCGLVQDPKPPRLATPHSCGNSCSRSRVCGHPCPLPCHPGPCPPCLITIQNPCHCGKDVIALVCSRANPTTGGNITLPASRSCGQTCGKPLSCGNHFCQDVCHDSKCPPCQRKELACGEGENKECAILTAKGEESWIGRFGCENTCERPFECGIHKCAKRCHPPSRVAPTCPYSPLAITHCPCGKHSLSDPSARSHFGSNARLIRTSCTDPPLEGCTHSCRTTCHTGPCPPASQAETDVTAFLCNRPCGALRSCGHHQCTRLCCPLANLANPTSKSKKKTVGTNVGVEFIDTEGWHLCDVICGKSLSCGNHRCEERDHRGSCPPCFRSSFEEIFCHCGRTVLEPPVPCGTQIVCSYPCDRPAPPCGHPKAPHLCHGDLTPCPPCVHLTEKICACGKTVVNHPCGRTLGCGFHPCEQLCHSGACAPCTAICGKSRKLCLPAQHPCTHPCHAPSVCPEVEPCSATIMISCACGRIQQSVQCGRSTSNPAGRDATLPRARNTRLAEALGIDPNLHKTNRNIVYSDELIAFARPNGKFVELVEKTLAEFVTSDKKVQVLPPMPESKRKFVHDLAAVYRMDTQMVDRGPNRSVQLIRRIDTRVPVNLLSQTRSAGNALGDLRAPARAPPAAVAGSGPLRGWNSVLAPSPARARTPPHAVPPGVNSSSAWTTDPISSVPLPRASTPTPPQSLGQPVTATPGPAAPSGEAVPDNWEDDDA
ncbi:hypothetical protein BGW80DRAFT_1302744 [Lactifluus volemus]|nr:hypothetical protein BGW80DRAFT_1302744 [Lactifluus volemus]